MNKERFISAEKNPRIYELAKEFVRPYEEFCVELMKKINNREENLFILAECPRFGRKILNVLGVFAFDKNFNILFPCTTDFRYDHKDIITEWAAAFSPSVISGPDFSVSYMESIYDRANETEHNFEQKDPRDFIMMDYRHGMYDNVKNIIKPAEKFEVIECTEQDVDQLLPLQLSFDTEEVFPPWKKETNAPSDRLSLERNTRENLVYAVKVDGKIVGKAQLNCKTDKYWQIGGVYTLPEYRNKGIACTLLQYIGEKANKANRIAALYVRKNNLKAIHSYGNAEYVPCGNRKTVYYNIKVSKVPLINY